MVRLELQSGITATFRGCILSLSNRG